MTPVVTELPTETLDLVHWTDPALTTPSVRFLGSVNDARELEAQLVATMRKHRGLGLSACQVGMNWQAIALGVEPNQVMFNARVVDQTEEGEYQEEACLSFPGIVASVWRPKVIKVRFQTADGAIHNEKYSGITARVIQHEMDHQNGRVFFDGLGKVSVGLLARKAKSRYGVTYPEGKLWQIVKKSQDNGARILTA